MNLPAAPDPAVSNAEPAAAQPSPPMATPTVRPPTASATAPAPPQEALQADTVLPPAQAAASMRLMYEVTGRVKGINYNASGSLVNWSIPSNRGITLGANHGYFNIESSSGNVGISINSVIHYTLFSTIH
mgnify:CR=1 FL=1